MKLTTLYKRATTGKTTEWTIEVEGNKYRMTTGYTDGKKTTSTWTECEGKNVGRANATTPEVQALAEATAIHRKRIEQGSFEDITKIDQKVFFKPMLAEPLEDFIDKVIFPAYSQPKLDGVRCIVDVSGMWTRQGKPILSAMHIREDLEAFFEANPDAVLDGELYCDKLASDFNKIISLVRKSKPTAADHAESKAVIQYHIYDYPTVEGNFIDRYKALIDFERTPLFPKSCVLVLTFPVGSREDMVTQYERYMEQGYEGQMIRLNKAYENKRSRSLLKDKRFVDAEYTILGVEEGRGNMSGKVGKLYFKNADGKDFDAAINGDWEYLAKLLKDKTLIGKKATVKYFNITPDGVPRFPKVIAIRDYEG